MRPLLLPPLPLPPPLLPALLLLALPFLAAAAPPARHAHQPAAPSAAPPATPSGPEPRGSPVSLAPRPGTPLDAAARRLVARDIAAGRAAGEAPLVLTGSAPLGSASNRPALFVQLQSARECGSGGCSTTVYLWQDGTWRRVLDGVGGRLTVGTAKTGGMADLMTEKGRYVWSGHEYQDPNPPPPIDLHLRR